MNLRVKLLADYYVGGTLQAILKPATVLLSKVLRRDHDLAHYSSLTFIKMMGGGRRFRREHPERKIEIRLMGARGDKTATDQLSDVIRMAFPGVVTANYAGKTSLAASVRGLGDVDELICIDSALLHYARLLGIPTISSWGPTDPASRLRESDVNHDEIHYHKLPCSPCVHVAQEPPCRGDNLCMRFAVAPDRQVDTNPKWILAEEPIHRFGRKLAP